MQEDKTPLRKNSERYSETVLKQGTYQNTEPTQYHKRESSYNPDINYNGEILESSHHDQTLRKFSKTSDQVMPNLSIKIHKQGEKEPMFFTPTYTPKQAKKP